MTDERTRKRIRLLIADDQKLFAESLKYVVEARADDIEVLEIAENGVQAIQMTRELKPDLILMDVRMPALSGVQATRIIHRESPGIRIVMLSTFQDDDDIRLAVRYGAIGYLLKNLTPEELIHAIRAVHAGTVQMSPSVARVLMRRSGTAPMESLDDEIYVERLTRRQKEVLILIMKSYENREIASFLNVQEQTARNYVHDLYTKLGVSSRMQLLRLLQRPGVLSRLNIETSGSPVTSLGDVHRRDT